MAAIMLQTNPSFYAKSPEKCICISAKPYAKYIVCEDYCIVHHGDKTCSLPAWKYHIILLGEIEEMLPKLDTFCFTYQHVDCLYTLFKYRFSGKIIAKSGNVFDNVRRVISFNQKKKQRSGRNAEYCKKRLLMNLFKQHFMSALQKKKSTQTSGSVFAERVEKVKRLILNWNF